MEIGDYIRTKDGYIGIYHSDTIIKDIINLKDKDGIFCTSKDNIIKYSKNIIDLIEVGDYVNGTRILDITGDYINTTEFNCCKSRLENKLKTIATKEQFKSIEYEV